MKPSLEARDRNKGIRSGQSKTQGFSCTESEGRLVAGGENRCIACLNAFDVSVAGVIVPNDASASASAT